MQVSGKRWGSWGVGAALGALALTAACAANSGPAAEAPAAQAETAPPASVPALTGFSDAVNHWRMENKGDYSRHAPEDVRAIADNILLLQRDHGGWVKNRDPQRVLTEADIRQLMAEKTEAQGSFDNRNVYTQIEYLLAAFQLTGDERYRAGADRGLAYLLRHQLEPCGGWPHSVPADTPYQDYITANDDVWSGILFMLRGVVEQTPPFDSFTAEQREAAAAALARGESCLLKVQVRQNGKLTAWAGQYDPVTLEPRGARTYELASLSSSESVDILRYLMSINDPSPEVIASVQGGVDWLKAVQINGLRVVRTAVPENAGPEFEGLKADSRLVEDADAPSLWARFYDLEDNSVVLANRDGIRVERYDQVHPERRTGYSWYGTYAGELISSTYPAWHCRVLKTTPEGAPCS